MNRVSILMAMIIIALTTSTMSVDGQQILQDKQRIVFLGDSNTYAGMYVQYFEAYLFARYPDKQFDVINLGLPSETISGLSEPDHPYPRPDLHERLARVLDKTKPNIVFLCYGMNDGIYYPFSEERFQKYKESIEWALKEIRAAGAKPIILTPPPFDPKPVGSALLPSGAPKFSWVHPFVGYDEVLTKYAVWLNTLRSKDLLVIELHEAIQNYIAWARLKDPSYHLAGDGVHIDARGHALIAEQILANLEKPAEERIVLDFRSSRSKQSQVSDIKITGNDFRFNLTLNLPMPLDPAWDKPLMSRTRLAGDFHRAIIKIRAAKQEQYTLFEGDRPLGALTREQLEAGFNLLQYTELSLNRRSVELLSLVRERERILGGAWLTYVGHKRPDTAIGLPLEEARTKAKILEDKIRGMAKPVPISLRLVQKQ